MGPKPTPEEPVVVVDTPAESIETKPSAPSNAVEVDTPGDSEPIITKEERPLEYGLVLGVSGLMQQQPPKEEPILEVEPPIEALETKSSTPSVPIEVDVTADTEPIILKEEKPLKYGLVLGVSGSIQPQSPSEEPVVVDIPQEALDITPSTPLDQVEVDVPAESETEVTKEETPLEYGLVLGVSGLMIPKPTPKEPVVVVDTPAESVETKPSAPSNTVEVDTPGASEPIITKEERPLEYGLVLGVSGLMQQQPPKEEPILEVEPPIEALETKSSTPSVPIEVDVTADTKPIILKEEKPLEYGLLLGVSGSIQPQYP